MILKTIRFRNFFSVGNAFIEIDLLKYKKSIFFGTNGKGKSTALNAITFALFGKTIKQVNRTQIVNSINNKACVVEIELNSGGKEFLVRRGIKPNIFEVFEDGILLDQTAVLDYQDFLEETILKCSYRTFIQTSIISIENYSPFMALSKAGRREFIEDILDIRVFTVMNQLLKTTVTKNKDELRLLDVKFRGVKEKVTLLKTNIDRVEGMQSASLETLNVRLVEYETELEENKKIISHCTELGGELSKGMAALRGMRGERDAINTKLNSVKNEIRSAEKELSFFETNDNCPSCKQGIQSSHVDSIRHNHNQNYAELVRVRDDLMDKLEPYVNVDDEYTKEQSSITECNSAMSLANAAVSRLNRSITVVNQEKLDMMGSIDISEMKAEMKEYAKDAINTKNRITELNESQEYNTVMLELFKDSGIKSKIVDQYIPVINTLINNYLEKFELFVSFNLDSEFSETIKSRHRDNFTYSSFSMGQRQRIDLALLFTFRQLAKMRNSFSCNFLGMDEILDSSTDLEGTEMLLNIFDSDEFVQTNLVVISHANKDMFADRFHGMYEFTMRDNFTEVTESVL
jgi:DNA repair exonuclease SbcCD ATPase subunit